MPPLHEGSGRCYSITSKINYIQLLYLFPNVLHFTNHKWGIFEGLWSYISVMYKVSIRGC